MPKFNPIARHLALAAGLLLAQGVLAADAPTTRPARTGGVGQGAREPGMVLKYQRQRLDELNLTDDQKTKIDAIYAAAEDELKKAAADSKGDDPQVRRQKIGPVLMGVREKTMAVLTDDQKQKYEKMGPAFGGAGAASPSRGSMVQRIRDNIDKIGLDDGQKTKAIAVLNDAQKKIDALTEEIKNGNADRTQLREKGLQISTETRQKLMDLTTPEQQAKLRALLNAENGGGGGGGATTRPARR